MTSFAPASNVLHGVPQCAVLVAEARVEAQTTWVRGDRVQPFAQPMRCASGRSLMAREGFGESCGGWGGGGEEPHRRGGRLAGESLIQAKREGRQALHVWLYGRLGE